MTSSCWIQFFFALLFSVVLILGFSLVGVLLVFIFFAGDSILCV